MRIGEQGFTLVEMLVVITIIALIMGLVGPRVLNFLGESKVKAAKIQIQSLSSALDLYVLDAGHYPTSSEGLEALMRRPGGEANWSGPYLKGDESRKPGADHTSTARLGSVGRMTSCLGADGQEGGTGVAVDITNASE